MSQVSGYLHAVKVLEELEDDKEAMFTVLAALKNAERGRQ